MQPKPASARKAPWIALVVILSPLILLLAIFAIVFLFLNRFFTYLLVWTLWLPRGKDVLFISSDSPVWQTYMREQLLPLIGKRAVIMNWSERSRWPKWSVPVHVFRTFGGSREFNPLIVVFRPLKRARCFRFFPAFKEWEHGDTLALERLCGELMAGL